MIDTKTLTKMVKHIVRRDKGLADPQIMHPTREWVIGLILIIVVVVAGSVFSLRSYLYYSDQLNMEIIAPEVTLPYSSEVVDRAINLYNEEKSVYNNILGQSTDKVVIDTPIFSIATTTAIKEIASSTKIISSSTRDTATSTTKGNSVLQ